MIKVLHVSTFDYGGAGLACLSLHRGLLSRGFGSKVLVLSSKKEEKEVYQYHNSFICNSPFLEKLLSFVFLIPRRFKIPFSRFEYYQSRLAHLHDSTRRPFFTLPFTPYDIVPHHLVQDADIIHLHWIADFVDYPSFFKKINKPVIWTIRDENPFLGGFHYHIDLDNSDGRYRLFDKNMQEIKKKSVTKCKNLTLVFLSRMMADLYSRHEIAIGRKTIIIPNLVDHQQFNAVNRQEARGKVGLPQDKKILCFVALSLEEERKGLKYLLQSVQQLRRSDLLVLAIGGGTVANPLEGRLVLTGKIDDPHILSYYYSSADVFVLSSFQEGFAKTPLEAMACGIPVVAFPCSGTEELINEKNGIRVADFTVDSLAEGIEKALATSYDREWIRNDVIERFGIEKIVSRYIDLYREVLQKDGDMG